MVCSVNLDTHEVKLISIYRDTYLNLGNDVYKKCNAAYARGGPEQAIGMINTNTDLYVTDYVTVGFEGLMKAVDALGGVEMDITETEMIHLNNYQSTMAAEMGIEYTPVTVSGMQNLNGLQATHTAGSVMEAVMISDVLKGRDVLTAMIEKGKTASISTLTEAMNAVLPNVQTSLDIEDILSMLGVLADFQVTVSDGFPFEECGMEDYQNGRFLRGTYFLRR